MSKFILRMKEMTAHSEKDLCPSCENGAQRTDAGGTVRTCPMFSRQHTVIHGRVSDCSEYYPKNLPSLRDMTAIAWEITTNKKTGKVGFITPSERRANQRLEVPEMD